MSTVAASLSVELARFLDSIDLSTVRSDQGWVLGVMRRDGPALVRLLWRMLGREQEVLDAYQECFCKLIASAHREGESPCRSYVFRVAVNVALDVGRRKKVQREHLPSIAAAYEARAVRFKDPADSADTLLADLRKAIAGLPERLRDVIILRDLAELRYRDVSRILGLTVGTARVYRREAIVELSKKMGAC